MEFSPKVFTLRGRDEPARLQRPEERVGAMGSEVKYGGDPLPLLLLEVRILVI